MLAVTDRVRLSSHQIISSGRISGKAADKMEPARSSWASSRLCGMSDRQKFQHHSFIVDFSRNHRSFVGYNNANYALSEVRDPVRTIKRAAPVAMSCVTIAYILANIAYFAVVPKDEILGSGRIVAALFFGKLWGVGAERVCCYNLTTW